MRVSADHPVSDHCAVGLVVLHASTTTRCRRHRVLIRALGSLSGPHPPAVRVLRSARPVPTPPLETGGSCRGANGGDRGFVTTVTETNDSPSPRLALRSRRTHRCPRPWLSPRSQAEGPRLAPPPPWQAGNAHGAAPPERAAKVDVPRRKPTASSPGRPIPRSAAAPGQGGRSRRSSGWADPGKTQVSLPPVGRRPSQLAQIVQLREHSQRGHGGGGASRGASACDRGDSLRSRVLCVRRDQTRTLWMGCRWSPSPS